MKTFYWRLFLKWRIIDTVLNFFYPQLYFVLFCQRCWTTIQNICDSFSLFCQKFTGFLCIDAQFYKKWVQIYCCFRNTSVFDEQFYKNEYKYTVVEEILQFLMNNFTKMSTNILLLKKYFIFWWTILQKLNKL